MRNKFKEVGEIAIADLQLDQANPRFGWLESQADCIEIMFEEYGDYITKIATHIAKFGLSPEPIVILNDKKNWIVKEGNRRVLALKVLNNPNEAPENRRATFHSIKQNAMKNAIPVKIKCLTAPEDVIQEYVALRHLGAQGGAGLVVWDPRGQENYRASQGQKLGYPQASALSKYLEDKGISAAKKIPLSNLQRIIQSKHTINILDLTWNKNKPIFKNEKWALIVLKEICLDFSERGKRVKDIYSIEKIESYINELISRPVVQNIPEVTRPTPRPAPSPMDPPLSPRGRTPKAAWDRPGIFPRRKVHFIIPDTEAKVKNIVAELSQLKVCNAPISVGVLLRTLIEISVKHYIKENKIVCNTDKELKNQIIHASNHMYSTGMIDNNYKKALGKMGNSEELLSISTLHDWVHNPKITPTSQNLCIFRDNIEPFIQNCWKKVIL